MLFLNSSRNFMTELFFKYWLLPFFCKNLFYLPSQGLVGTCSNVFYILKEGFHLFPMADKINQRNELFPGIFHHIVITVTWFRVIIRWQHTFVLFGFQNIKIQSFICLHHHVRYEIKFVIFLCTYTQNVWIVLIFLFFLLYCIQKYDFIFIFQSAIRKTRKIRPKDKEDNIIHTAS